MEPMAPSPVLYLASSSPRRRELLTQLGLPFRMIKPAVDEKPWAAEKPASHVLRLASEKARCVFRQIQPKEESLIIAADTIVVLNDQILGKPSDTHNAFDMLRKLSDGWHVVITGLCVLHSRVSTGFETGIAVHTHVHMKALSDEEIRAYIATGEPMDKAGAYAIQGGAASMIQEIRGSLTNVIGLPLETLRSLLQQP